MAEDISRPSNVELSEARGGWRAAALETTRSTPRRHVRILAMMITVCMNWSKGTESRREEEVIP